jgi:topoisomerase-4 subunit A
VQKSRLVEQLASLIELKKAPLLGDVRDESAETVRLVIEPKVRTVEPETMMESLFRLCDLETRFPVNMNVLDKTSTPRVMGLKPALQAFLDHRREVDGRRTRWRLSKIEARLHVLDGLLIVFLNLDEVIRIVRYEDEPRAKLMAAFELSDVQADAILNTRLRQLAKLEEMELRREHTELTEEQAGLNALLASDKKQWAKVANDLRAVREALGKDASLSRRRSSFSDAPMVDTPLADAFVLREPITVIISARGWIRAAKGRVENPSELKFKEGDKLDFLTPAETTDKLLIFASDGRFFTLPCDKLPSARGQGEPLRLMLDLDDKTELLSVFPYTPGAKRLLASSGGYGFIAPEDELLANRKAGKQVLNVDGGKALICLPIKGDHVATVGDNGKALIFPIAELPIMPRGKGVKLQSYREGGLRDVLTFDAAAGATWIDGAGRSREWLEWRNWLGKRAASGRHLPKGFPVSKRFRPR